MKISVVIPAYNAARTIRACLGALEAQSAPRDSYEIILVDDGSSDGTPEIVKKEFPGVRLLSQSNSGPAAARNNGAKAAAGEMVFFTDADCRPMADWVARMAEPFSAPEVAGVKGIYRTEQPQLTARFVQVEYEDKYDLMAKDHYIDFIDTYSAGFRREIFNSMGGYDCSFPVACSEDAEFSFRLANAGHKMVFVPGAVVYHIHPDAFSAYVRKKYKFAYWRMLAVKKNPNKLVKDSHTPQVMKLQLLLAPAVLLAAAAAPLSSGAAGFFLGAASFYLLLSLPFVMKAARKDFAVGLLSPAYLFARSLAQFLGVARGVFDIFVLNKYK